MLNRRENIEVINPSSFIMVLLLIIGLLVFYGISNNGSDKSNNPTPSVTLITQSSAFVSNGIQINCIQKSWISNKDNFKLLTFDKTQFLENKKTDLKITLLENNLKTSKLIQEFFLRYHLFPSEKDDLPDLG
ncbi:MAG: hypothetical protein ABSA76_06935 [Bacteroidales bacterium]